jgi:hypothetical protein
MGATFAALVYLLTFFDVGTAFVPSVGGDALLRIVNDGSGGLISVIGTSAPAGPAATVSADVCANIYVFNDVQELQECCSCPLTPNSLLTFSVINDLTSNPLNPKGNLSAGVIKIVSSAGDVPHCNNAPGAVTAASFSDNFLAPGLHGWISHTQTIASNQATFTPPYGFVTSTSVARMEPAVLGADELGTELQAGCAAINSADKAAGQSTGICLCGLGD